MTRDEILATAAATFGGARITTSLINDGLHPRPETTLEVRGLRDHAWRPLGSVAFDQTSQPIVNPHPRALPEDRNRASAILV